MGMVKEFRDFAMKGNVVDLAVGIIIGGAFGKIVSSLVGDVIMPVVGYMTAGVDVTQLKHTIQEKTTESVPKMVDGAKVMKDGKPEMVDKVTEAVVIRYGEFIQTIIDFIIIAFCIFLIVKIMNSMKKKEEAAPKAPPKEEVLLTEIRDILAKKS